VWLQRLALLAGSMALALALAELALRLFREHDRYYPHHRSTVRTAYPDEADMPGVSGVSYFTTNSHGCRGPEYSGEKHRLLTVGGSTTECVSLDDAEAWPALVMARVNERTGDPKRLWVTNAGVAGRNSRHHLAHAELLVPKIGRLDVVLVYCGLNDAGLWLYLPTFDAGWRDDADEWERTVAQAFRVTNHTDPDAPWWKRLELWKTASVLKDAHRSRRQAFDRDRGAVVQDDRFRWLGEMRAHRARAEKRLVPRAKMETLPAALDSYADNLRRIAAAVRRAGSRPVFVAQAVDRLGELDEAGRKRLWMGHMEGGAYVEEGQMADLVVAHNDRMRQVCQEIAVPFIDLPAALESERDLYYDGIHFNEKGARETARVVADALLERRLLEAEAPRAGS
jgi:lysophospholipase L1-like esterase